MNDPKPSPPELPREFVSWERDRWMFEQGGVVMLMYHKIAPAPVSTNLPALYVRPDEFDRHLTELTGAGLPAVTYGEVLNAVEAGRRGFCVTFDDGFRNVSDLALPVLRRHGIKAMQFIVAGLIGKTDEWDHPIGEPPQPLMDEGQIREWLAEGHEIGAHTMTHPRLTTLPPERARAEIFDGKRLLEDRFGVVIRHFCYPYGDENQRIRDLVSEAGYESAPTVAFGTNSPGTPPLALNRVMACDAPAPWRKIKRKVARLIRLGR